MQLARRFRVLVWILLCCSFGGFSSVAFANQKNFSIDGKPSWVELKTYSDHHNSELSQPLQYLLVDRQLNVTKGRKQRYFRQVRRPLNSSGVEQGSEVKVVFNTDYEYFTLHQIKIIRKGVVRDITHTEKPRFIHQEPEAENLIYTGLTTAIFNLVDVRVGDIIDVSYSLNGQNPIFGDRPFGAFSVNWPVVVDQFSINLIADKVLNVELFNAPGKIRRESINGGVKYSYQASPTQAIFEEDNVPPDVTSYGSLEYSAYDSWQDVNRWAQSLYRPNYSGIKVPELSAKLSQSVSSKPEYVMAALNFVQNEIRYLGLEYGENTHLPHMPDETLNARYGDCKDKAVLLNALLSHKGIKSHAALVNTKRNALIDRMLPSPGAFDHVINFVEIDGKQYWLDATALYQGEGLDTVGKFDYGSALVVGRKGGQLVDMYEQAPLYNHVRVEESLTFAEFGEEMVFSVKTVYSQRSAENQRYRFANNTLDKISSEYLRYYQDFYPSISMKEDIEYFDDRKNNRFTVEETYLVDGNWDETKYHYVVPVSLTFYQHYLPKLSSAERETPYYIGYPAFIESQFSIFYPQPVDLNFKDTATVYEEPSFRYTNKDEYQSQVYTHKSSLEIRADRVLPEDISTYSKKREALVDEWYFSIRNSKPDLFDGYDKIIRLKQRLKLLKEQYNEG